MLAWLNKVFIGETDHYWEHAAKNWQHAAEEWEAAYYKERAKHGKIYPSAKAEAIVTALDLAQETP